MFLGRLRIIAAMLLLLVTLPVHRAAAQNLVSNPGFESGTTNWGGPNVTISNSATGTHSGTNALKVVAQRFGILYQVLSEVPPQNREYRLSAWMKSASNSIITMRISSRGGHFTSSTETLLSTTWTNISRTFHFVPTATATNFLVEFINFDINESSTTFFLDDVSLVSLAPQLTFLGISSNHAVFEWPVTSSYHLRSTTNLAVPDWTQAFGNFEVTNNNFRIYIPTNGHNSFYRLTRF